MGDDDSVEQVDDGDPANQNSLDQLRRFRDSMVGFLLGYQFGIEEIMTKINVLKAEFEHLHEYSPIEHVTSRLKKPESIIAKLQRQGGSLSLASVQRTVRDIAGIRVVCSFIQDAYKIADALTQQEDIKVLQVKDYIENPKANGYRSLHLILEVPVFLSSRTLSIPVEVQIRTIAMDFWASLEHKIYYKFRREVPQEILEGLHEAAITAARLDRDMEQIHMRVRDINPVEQHLDLADIDLEMVLPPAQVLSAILADE